MKSDRQVVKREFGGIKRPMDMLSLSKEQLGSGGRTPNQLQILKTSPRIKQLMSEEDEERTALTERSSSKKKAQNNLKIDELLQQFDRLHYKTLTGKKAL
jgi:hypothetical protein